MFSQFTKIFMTFLVLSAPAFAQDLNKTTVKNGQSIRVGAWEWRDAEGHLLYRAVYNDAGLEDGKFQQFYPSGQRLAEMTYVQGKVDGLSTRWWPDGHLREQALYRAGRLHGVRKRWTYEPGDRKVCPDDLAENELDRIDLRQAAGHCCSTIDESCWAGAEECWIGGERRSHESCDTLYAGTSPRRAPASE